MTDLLDFSPSLALPARPDLRLLPPASERADLDIVIPAFNEEQRIGPTLTRLNASLSGQAVRARVLVVDNGSVDGTVDLISRHTNDAVPVRVLNCRHRGKGAAVRAGIAEADAPYVAYIDADQSTPPEALLAAVALLDHGWDGVIGSRRAFGGRYVVPQPALRRVGSRAFNLAATRIVGPISDTQCGMKVFRTREAQQIFAATTTTGFAFDVEVLARARSAGLRLMELPVDWSDSSGSTFSPVRHGLSAFRDLAAVHRNARSITRATAR